MDSINLGALKKRHAFKQKNQQEIYRSLEKTIGDNYTEEKNQRKNPK